MPEKPLNDSQIRTISTFNTIVQKSKLRRLIVLVVYYLPSILQNSVGLSHRTALIIPGFAVCMFVIGGIWPSLTLDHMGRRKTMVSDGGATTRGTNFAAASVAFFFLYLLAFGASLVLAVAVEGLSHLHGRNFISVTCIYFFYPETSNLRLEDIDHIFAEGGNPVSRARKMQECLSAGISPTEEPDEEQAYSKHEGGAQTIESVP
ncbi:hypothetical protein J7T55_000437 [Diaporthe amygdali]|uniref:uncharacterized protein n=1 Tax=Phomopsis amygdali TaxID=1214568 RepID=UPI0022FECD7D|nr:uncharacterized protein J7T55_000437 [Diaporthe amygdali]KAJ0109511.1 hypothetical protein J7T55_000437 [Diaporthe amygdali]